MHSEDEFDNDQMVTEQRAMIDHLTDYIQLLTTTNLHSGPTNSFAGNIMTKSKQTVTSKTGEERESPLYKLSLLPFTSPCFSTGLSSTAKHLKLV